MSSKIKYLIAILLLVILLAYLVKRCNKPTNDTVDRNTKTVQQTEEIVKVNDSVKAIQQRMLITEDPNVVRKLQDSIQGLINRMANIKPSILIRYKEVYEEAAQTGKLKDSLSGVIDDLLDKSRDNLVTALEFEAYRKEVLSRKIPYKIESKYRYESGHIDYQGNIVSDTLRVESEPLITVGEKGGFLKRPTYTVSIGNKNPLITSSNASSLMYIPKEKVQFSVGPMGLTNGKDVTAGVGVNLKKGIFSVSVGYLLVNTKNK